MIYGYDNWFSRHKIIKIINITSRFKIIEHHLCFCPECGQDVISMPFEHQGKRQVIEIPKIK